MSRRLIVYLALLAAAGLWAQGLRARRDLVAHAADFTRVPARIGRMLGTDESFDSRTMQELRADRVLGRLYQDAASGASLELFIAYFGSQETGSQIHSPQNCLPGGGWHILARSRWTIPTGAGPRGINEFVISKGEGRQLVHYWFLTRSGVISNEFRLKWDLVCNSLLGRPTDAAFIRLVRPVGPDGLDAARSDLRAFSGSILPILDDAIPIAPRRIPVARAN